MNGTDLERFAAVRAALARKAAASRLLGRISTAEQEDPDSMVDEGDIADAPPLQFHLLYQDDHGRRSQRVVTVRAVETRGAGTILRCFCHLREAPRSFAIARIMEVFDVSSGEVYDNPSSFFLEHPLLGTAATAEDRAVQSCQDELVVLVVVAACDGLLHPDEEDQLLIHVFDRCSEHLLDEQMVRRHVGAIVPDEASFRSALGRLSRRSPADLEPFSRTLRRLVDADGRLHSDEVRAVVDIETHLGCHLSV